MPEALISITTSPGPGSGSRKFASSSLRLPKNVTPRIVSSRVPANITHSARRAGNGGPLLTAWHDAHSAVAQAVKSERVGKADQASWINHMVNGRLAHPTEQGGLS